MQLHFVLFVLSASRVLNYVNVKTFYRTFCLTHFILTIKIRSFSYTLKHVSSINNHFFVGKNDMFLCCVGVGAVTTCRLINFYLNSSNSDI